MVSVLKKKNGFRDQILAEAVCISLYANALWKGMNPLILTLVGLLVWEKEKLWIQDLKNVVQENLLNFYLGTLQVPMRLLLWLCNLEYWSL